MRGFAEAGWKRWVPGEGEELGVAVPPKEFPGLLGEVKAVVLGGSAVVEAVVELGRWLPGVYCGEAPGPTGGSP